MAPKSVGRGPREAGIGQRWAPPPRDYVLVGRSHPAAGSHLPSEDTALPLRGRARFYSNPNGTRALRADCFVRLLAKGAPRALHEGPAKRDRAAAGDAATAIMDWLGACIPLRGRIFLRKLLLNPSRSHHSLRRLSRIPSRKAAVAPAWDSFRGSR